MPYRRITEPEHLQRLLDAVLMIGADVELGDLLRHLVEEACRLAGARYGALGVLDETRTCLVEFLTVGMTEAEELATGRLPTGRGVLGTLIAKATPTRIASIATHPDALGFPPGHPPMTSFLGVPIRVRVDAEPYGNLYLTDKIGAPEFSDEDEALVEGLAHAAGIAILNTRLHERVRILGLLDDRDRIAMALHDTVIQRIYASGLALQSATHEPDAGAMASRVNRVIDDLDTTITLIRTAIYELGDRRKEGLRSRVFALVEQLTPALGARPQITIAGPVDEVSPNVATNLLAVVRESLTNAGKHAHATTYMVVIRVADELSLEVIDDGIGLDLSDVHSEGMGIGNLRSRATKLGGTLVLEPAMGGGTKVVWRVPLQLDAD